MPHPYDRYLNETKEERWARVQADRHTILRDDVDEDDTGDDDEDEGPMVTLGEALAMVAVDLKAGET